jgi:hypothetical protein
MSQTFAMTEFSKSLTYGVSETLFLHYQVSDMTQQQAISSNVPVQDQP